MDRFALEVARGGDVNAARAALAAAAQLSGSELHGAALLARALWSPNGSEEERAQRRARTDRPEPGQRRLGARCGVRHRAFAYAERR